MKYIIVRIKGKEGKMVTGLYLGDKTAGIPLNKLVEKAIEKEMYSDLKYAVIKEDEKLDIREREIIGERVDLRNYVFSANYNPLTMDETPEVMSVSIPAYDIKEAQSKLAKITGAASLWSISDIRPY